MVLFNYSTRELTAKIVYYGPGLCGKTTNLQFIHENLPQDVRGKMLSLATKTDRTLFFDFLPIDLGDIRGMKTRVQLYTVPGQVFYNETRKLVLKGADGIVFVADSQETMLGANVESFKNLEENLKAHGLRLADMPHVLQFNKRDLPRLTSIEDLNGALNRYNAPFYESVATTGIGVQDTLKAIVKLVLLYLTRKYEPKGVTAAEESMAASLPTPARPAASASKPQAPAARQPAPPMLDPQPVAAAAIASKPTSKAAAPASPPPPAARTAAPTSTPLSRFEDSEIDSLVDEVDRDFPADVGSHDAAWEGGMRTGDDGAVWLGSPEDDRDWNAESASVVELAPSQSPSFEAASVETRPVAESFEIDKGFDPEWHPEDVDAPLDDSRLPAPPPEIERPPAIAAEEPVLLEEVAANDDLFSDPGLEVATFEPGDVRDIVVPIQLGHGAQVARYKLTLRLRFDPAE